MDTQLPPTNAGKIQTEVGHVLFMDLAGYSKLSIENQARLESTLRDAVRKSEAFQSAVEGGDLISIDTGDGMALVFFGDPTGPARCALEVKESTKHVDSFMLRIGLHSGPVTRTTDINGKPNVKGTGINMAQRVMDCSSPGKIFLSETYAEFLSSYGEWAAKIERLGEFSIKHDLRLRICSLRTEEGVITPEAPEPAPPIQPSARPPSAGRIALIYKRNASPDDTVLHMLERCLNEEGFSVFIDRHLSVGVEWAQEIESQIRNSDAVVALVSQRSSTSEMMEYELQVAFEEFQKRGKPRILPVRIQFSDPVPGEMGSILDRFQYVLWGSEEDSADLKRALIEVLKDKSKPKEPVFALEPPGGAMSPKSPYYVERETDPLFMQALNRQDSIVLVKGARQMGKTSLLARGVQECKASDVRVVVTDFQTLNADQLATPEALYKAIIQSVAMQMRLKLQPDQVWTDWLGPNMNLEQFILGEVIEASDKPLVWILDEVDRLFNTSYASEIFGLFRSWHNRRQLDPTSAWSQLTMAIAYATEAHLFITDLHQSPFNVGTRLELSDFDLSQLSELNDRFGSPLQNDTELRRFHALVGGHPYLVRRGLDELVRNRTPVSDLEPIADRDEGPFGDHLRRILVSVTNSQGLMDALTRVLQGKEIDDGEAFYRLRTAGLIAGGSAGEATMRCQLYQKYLARHLL